jgi:hypothetical protein
MYNNKKGFDFNLIFRIFIMFSFIELLSIGFYYN